MASTIAAYAIMAILVLVAVNVVHSTNFKGWFGERLVAWFLARLDQNLYRVLNNVYLPLPDGTTTQIDHIVASPYGVFVIETKTYRGWIFGDANSKVWTQCIREKGYRSPVKHTFQNPIHQNYAHLCALEGCTGIPRDVMRPVIAFSGEAKFKTDLPSEVCHIGAIPEYIKSFTTPVIKLEQVGEIAETILAWQKSLSREQIAHHVDNLRRRHAVASPLNEPPTCPHCGATMILRKSKKDDKAFYGCSTYPKCRGIVNI